MHFCKPKQFSSLIHMPIQSKTQNRKADFLLNESISDAKINSYFGIFMSTKVYLILQIIMSILYNYGYIAFN